MYHFDSDYMEGAHPAILERLTAINFDKHDGDGCDYICDSARARIREACGAPGPRFICLRAAPRPTPP